MSGSSDAAALAAWVAAVARELGLEGAVDSGELIDVILDMTADVAHGVSRPAAPVTAFLIGLAAGRAEDPAVAARDHAQVVTRLADGWDADRPADAS